MQAVKRLPVVQQVVNSLKEYIISGKTEVGEKLPSEKELCEMLDVGRGTIREAVRVLQALGFVEMRPGRGAFIARKEEMDPAYLSGWFMENEVEIVDFLRVRTAIEPLAIKLAIRNCTDKDVADLMEIHRSTMEAVENNNAPMLATCDEQFHAVIVECSKNKLLISINKVMTQAMRKFRGKTFYVPSNAHNILQPHHDILQAFIDRNEEEGERAMLKHLEYILRDLENSKKI